ncbi:hypothetical protein [Promicromonospora panici]|uniref:hypothetical protein n=1 Tax=Promicromonospora panici TaxID=2219658 RepID=UPI00101DC8DA|nr:hypothetical protein [Promicromonospora panici]
MVTTIEEPRIRPEWLLGGAITLLGAIIIIVVTLVLGAREDEPVVTPADATALTAGSCAENLRQPHWVPEEVRRAVAECPADISAGIGRTTAEDHLGTWVIYLLDGAENAETFRGDPGLAWPEEEVRAGAYHPASTITYVAYAGSAELSDELSGDNVTVEWEELTESGREARVTRVDNNGYGPVRVEWTDDAGSYLLLGIIGRTPTGSAGPTVAELIRIADSVAANDE